MNLFWSRASIRFVDPSLEKQISVSVTSKNNWGWRIKSEKEIILQFRDHVFVYFKKKLYIKDKKRPFIVSTA